MSNDIPSHILVRSARKQHPHIADDVMRPYSLHEILTVASERDLEALERRIQAEVKSIYGVGGKTTQAVIWSALRINGFDEQATYDFLRPRLGGAEKPLRLQYNPGNGAQRANLPMSWAELETGYYVKADGTRIGETMPMRLASDIIGYHRDYCAKFGIAHRSGGIVVEPESCPPSGLAPIRSTRPLADPAATHDPEPADPAEICPTCGGVMMPGSGCENGCDPVTIVGDPEPAEPAEPVTIVDPRRAAKDMLREINLRMREYQRKLEKLRKFADARTDIPTLDSMRLAIDGQKLIAAGLPVSGVLDNITSQWSADSKIQAGIDGSYDWVAWGENLPAAQRAGDFDHGATPAIMAAIIAGTPVWIWGGAGIGKSVGAAKAAEKLSAILGREVEYHELNLSGQGPGVITGVHTIDGFLPAKFVHAYTNGHIFNGEEIDAADPRVLTAINNAIANGYFFNPADQTMHVRHKDFRIVVTANTNGTGSARGFLRNKVDKASVDRFSAAMFHLTLDHRLERNIIGKQNSDLLALIEAGEISPLGF